MEMAHRGTPVTAAIVGRFRFGRETKTEKSPCAVSAGNEKNRDKPLALFRPADKNRNKPLVLDAMSLTSHECCSRLKIPRASSDISRRLQHPPIGFCIQHKAINKNKPFLCYSDGNIICVPLLTNGVQTEITCRHPQLRA